MHLREDTLLQPQQVRASQALPKLRERAASNNTARALQMYNVSGHHHCLVLLRPLM